MDSYGAVEKGISIGLEEFWQRVGEDWALHEEFAALSEEGAVELGRQAVRAALAPLVWSAAIGERWDVRRTAEFLKISRQALYKKLRTGGVLGLRGRGTTWFPVWQFDPDHGIVRSITGRLIATFRDADSEVDPLVIAAWAVKDLPTLEGRSPARWVAEGGDEQTILTAALRAASGLSA